MEIDPQWKAKQEQRNREELEKAIAESMSRDDVPSRYRSARMTDFKPDSFRVPDKFGPGVFITGPAGSGKTHLAAAFRVAYLERHGAYCPIGSKVIACARTAPWANVPDLLYRIRRSFNIDHKRAVPDDDGLLPLKESDIVDPLRSANMVVLDDFGAEKATPWSGQLLYLLVSWRLDRVLPLIITSNLSIEDIDTFDPRLASRCAAMQRYVVNGPDVRQTWQGGKT